jgi:hypothetical protein|tara:strand:+ start:1124 stop:1369 length:246 start_codon:yes stop_codon:yes gene_type:complete
MASKYLYIVEHYVPFPQSEYGGIWNVIADNDEECFDLITAADSSDFNVQYYGDLRENITSGQVYKLDEENVVSGIVEEFTT